MYKIVMKGKKSIKAVTGNKRCKKSFERKEKKKSVKVFTGNKRCKNRYERKEKKKKRNR